jgi:hypothetical protein
MIVWIFREQRSGSTAFTSLIASRLNRTVKLISRYPEDIETVKNISDPENYVFSTHSYNFIEIMNSFNKPVVLIRCARQDKIERCISLLIAMYKTKRAKIGDNVWNIMRYPSEYENFTANIEPTVFTKKEVYKYLQYHTEINQHWENNAASYENCTVFYEDLCTDTGVDLPMLGLTSLSITTDESSTIKLPTDYKKQLCLNYDMVARWITEYYSEKCPDGGMVDTQR